MAKCIDRVVLAATKDGIKHVIFFNLSCDEVIACDTQSYISVNANIIKDWEHLPLLLTLGIKVQDGATSEAITKTMYNVGVVYGGLYDEALVGRMISFEVD